MIDLKNIQIIYFIGIGGIGMSALARYFKSLNKKVSGYDKAETALIRELMEEGIPVHFEDDPGLAPKNADLIVFTPAIPKDHQELSYYLEHDYPVFKRSDVLGAITLSSFNICVAGTHGKTTISTMIAHILRHSGFGCNAFLGGIATNYQTNFWSSERNVCVVEADEYDRSFLKLNPDIAVITAMDADHLDIYGTVEAMEEAYVEFSGKIKQGGLLLSKSGISKGKELKAPAKLTYSLNDEHADIQSENILAIDGSYSFDVKAQDWRIDKVRLNMGGLHNVENAIAAIAIASRLEIDKDAVKAAVDAFRGVKRRFQYIIKKKQLVFIDDYAHHPEELSALLTGAKNLFPGMKCTIIFQPHLFTRTRDLAQEFAKTLDVADEVILLPVYPARELPIPAVTSVLITDKMRNTNNKIMEKQELYDYLKQKFGSLESNGGNVLITAGAGDIDAMVEPIRKLLN